jgi:hypothetical protein
MLAGADLKKFGFIAEHSGSRLKSITNEVLSLLLCPCGRRFLVADPDPLL